MAEAAIDIPSVNDVVAAWSDSREPASFAGRKYLIASLQAQYPEAPRRAIADRVRTALATLPAYTIHHPRRRRFMTGYYSIASFYRLFEVDLADVHTLAEANDDVRFLLVGVEAASRRIFVETCVNKEGATVAAAMRNMLSSMPQMIRVCRSDRGSEFRSRQFRALLREHDIHQQFASNESKAALAERAIAKVMGRVYRFMSFSTSRRYVDALPSIVRALNMTPHAHTRVAALQFRPERDLYRVWEETVLQHQPIMRRERGKRRAYKFAIGDTVRLSHTYEPFRKGFAGYWTPEYFRIVARAPGPPRTYRLQDVLGKPIGGEANEMELLRVRDSPATRYPIAKVWQRRRRAGRRESLVSFQSWPKAHRVWVQDDDEDDA